MLVFGPVELIIHTDLYIEKLGEKATAIPLEKNYYLHLQAYYMNLKKIGLDYESLDFEKAIDFIRMTARGLMNKK